MTDNTDEINLVDLTTDIVAAYVGNNTVAAGDLPNLIQHVHDALHQTVSAANAPEPEPLKPAVPVRKSVTPDFIICLEDGKKFKSLKRHLRTRYDLTPEEYRENGDLRPTIRWWPPIMRRRARRWPSRWASVSSVNPARRPEKRKNRRRWDWWC